MKIIQKYNICTWLAVALSFCVLAGALSLPAAALGKVIYSGASTDSKRVALTFDDGPHPSKTERILDILRKYGVRATFFVIGENAAALPGVVLREFSEGHEIGNHTYSHERLTECDDVLREVEKTSDIVERITGKRPALLRPPEGVYCPATVENAQICGCDVVLWNVDTRDWAKESTESIVENVKANVRNGSIILFHDFTGRGTHTEDALEIVIPYLIEQGYEFVTVSELIK